ncbi:MAG: hypothetical protein ONB48_21420 [candidate division KSB1 bacterium]|nr:hypothetical protein [candidate division KSB1 bacterium]MDZ7274841.1 hypothetical protein [candidate division KSB1 bacterium]MDZ7288208.1 hypothetical protein [candidate division KSB1 bacterium]MDZ7300411.1 hypothetical protein [candidate division KSB1 bacterium]MDZ7308134.1 hypothetical protein [candidate division KSB1 bacterium]
MKARLPFSPLRNIPSFFNFLFPYIIQFSFSIGAIFSNERISFVAGRDAVSPAGGNETDSLAFFRMGKTGSPNQGSWVSAEHHLLCWILMFQSGRRMCRVPAVNLKHHLLKG